MADNVVDVRFGAQTAEFNAGINEVKAETRSLAQIFGEAAEHMSAVVREPLDALAMMRSSLRETAEIAGAAFAIEEIKRFVEHMAELGEKTVNTAAAIGMSAEEFSALSGAMRVLTGNSEISAFAILHLGLAMEEALTTKGSRAAKAATSLGLTHAQLAKAAKDTSYAIDLLADTFVKFENDGTKASDFEALFGRRMVELVPLLK